MTRITIVKTTSCLEARTDDKQMPLLEALYLAYRGKAELVIDNTPVTLEDVVRLATECDPDIWVKLEVYIDLRKRGRILSPGPRPNTLLMKRKKSEPYYKIYILILEENKPIPVSLIEAFIEEARKNSWEPLIAIVDRYGDITYYTPTLFKPYTERR